MNRLPWRADTGHWRQTVGEAGTCVHRLPLLRCPRAPLSASPTKTSFRRPPKPFAFLGYPGPGRPASEAQSPGRKKQKKETNLQNHKESDGNSKSTNWAKAKLPLKNGGSLNNYPPGCVTETCSAAPNSYASGAAECCVFHSSTPLLSHSIVCVGMSHRTRTAPLQQKSIMLPYSKIFMSHKLIL